MLVACRLAGLSALETHYAGVTGLAQPDAAAVNAASPRRRAGAAIGPALTTSLRMLSESLKTGSIRCDPRTAAAGHRRFD